jgi:hypothetical protein
MTDLLQSPVKIEWRLVLTDGSNATKIIPVNRETLLLGRAVTADIHLDDAHISRHHARFIFQDQQLLVEDLQTINGTYVNGQALTTLHTLRHGDVVTLGPFTINAEQSLVPVPQTRQETRAYTPPPPSSKRNLGLWLGLAAALLIFLIFASLGAYWFILRNPTKPETGAATSLKGPDISVKQAPQNNDSIPINQPVTVQVEANDPTGVTRIELWANGRKMDEVDTQLVQVLPTLNAGLEWTPAAPGRYALEVRAYNEAGLVNLQLVTTLQVVGLADTPTPTALPLAPTSALPTPRPTPTLLPAIPTSSFKATPTLIPELPTSVVPPTPTPNLAVLAVTAPTLNVRAGPGTAYDLLGQLTQGNKAAIVGQAEVEQSQWWLIRFDKADTGLGWVSADNTLSTASNASDVPALVAPPLLQAAVATPVANSNATPAAAVAASVTNQEAIKAPAGKTLLIISNRSLTSQPALLTLSGGKSVGGGKEVNAPAGQDVQLELEPDQYQAMWSSPARRGGFVASADFNAEADRVIVAWIIPEDGVTQVEIHEQLIIDKPAPTSATPTPAPVIASNYSAPEGKVVLVAVNRTVNNSYAVLTVAGGTFGAGKEIKLDAGNEIPLELGPGDYRMVWSSPAYSGGFSAGREFTVFGGEVVYTWIVPEQGEVFIQFPSYEPEQLK